MPEVLLSSAMLVELGVDPNHLVSSQDVFDRLQDSEYSHVGQNGNAKYPSRTTVPITPSKLAKRLLDLSDSPSSSPALSKTLSSAPFGKASLSRSYLSALQTTPLRDESPASRPMMTLKSASHRAVFTSRMTGSEDPRTRDTSASPCTAIVPQKRSSFPSGESIGSPGAIRSTSLPSPLFYGDGCDDDPLRTDDEPLPGVDDPKETLAHLRDRVREAEKNGMSADGLKELEQLLTEFRDIFRTKLGNDPPADVEPMTIKLKPDAKPMRVKLRRYSPPQTAFLRKKTDELLELGLIRRNNKSQWACAPLIVPKPGPEQFRFTVDLRPVNEQTVVYSWPMPHVEAAVTQLAHDTCYASIDLCHGYWQMPLAASAQECQSFITPDGVFTPNRVLHGQSNAVFYFQSTVGELCLALREVILQWLDDLLFHCHDERHLLTSLRKFFEICQAHRLKLHAAKCKFFLRTVHWCGRIISPEGVKLDPARMQAIRDMRVPVTGDQLQQFVCAAGWMRAGIPEFSRVTQPLADVLEEVYALAGKRTRTAAAKIWLKNTSWGKSHEQAFERVRAALERSITLAHPNASRLLCLFTDASTTHWAAVLTQIPKADLDTPVAKQRHAPLAFLSGGFKGSSARWSTAEKEAFAIVAAVTRLDYILLRPEGFLLFTDHRNLVYIFASRPSATHIPRHVANKLERWALTLAAYNYTIVHIPGDSNTWADLLTRWGAPAQIRSLAALRCYLATITRAPVEPSTDFAWPTKAKLVAAQRAALEGGEKLPREAFLADDLWRTKKGATWIPTRDTALQLRLCIIGHCGRAGHRGAQTTLENMSPHVWWRDMQTDVFTFCNTCLHCQATTGGRRIPRPLAHTVHAEKPNEVLHFDYLYLYPSDTGEQYILIIKDDASVDDWNMLTMCSVSCSTSP